MKLNPKEGVRRSWLVSIDSLQVFRDARQRQGQSPGGFRVEQQSADIAAQPPGNPIRELADRLVDEASRAAEFRVRLEISEKADSTLREALAEERHRREEAERERDDLRQELYALREPRESPQTVEEEQGRGQSSTPLRERLRRAHSVARGGVGCWEVSVDEKSLQLLKVMREQLGETSATRIVDAGAAANSLGMYPGTLDRSLLYLVRAGYLEESADHAMATQGMYLITFQGIAAIDNA